MLPCRGWIGPWVGRLGIRDGQPEEGKGPGGPSGDLWLYPVTENPCVYAAITNTATKSSTETLKPTMKML